MTDFYRFPHTPHLAWLGSAPPRDDKVLTPQEAKSFLSADVLVEEKVDGANLGFSVDAASERTDFTVIVGTLGVEREVRRGDAFWQKGAVITLLWSQPFSSFCRAVQFF